MTEHSLTPATVFLIIEDHAATIWGMTAAMENRYL